MAALLGLCALAVTGCDRFTQQPLNLLVICLDTVRFDTFWLPEEAGFEDPLSLWNPRALRFQSALTPSPWTLPAVASLLTGRYPARHGAGFPEQGIANLDVQVPNPLASDVPTLSELLFGRGYEVAGFVSQPYLRPQFGLNRGFFRLVRRHEIVERTEAWLDERAERPARDPFFLYLHFIDAHEDHMADPEQVRESAAALSTPVREAIRASAPAGQCSPAKGEPCLRYLAYAGAVLKQRAAVAQLLDGLERRGLLDRTIVLLYSDHGEEFQDHLQPQRERGTDPRGIFGIGHGHSMYQELLHVPLLVWHPRLAGREVEHQVSLVDVVPTFAEWLGLADLEVTFQGRSLATALRSPGAAGSTETQPLFASSVSFGPAQRAVVLGSLKRIHREEPEQRLLFDLAADPLEERPIEDPALAAPLDRLLAYYRDTRDTSDRTPARLDAETLRALQELGYLEDATTP